MHLSVNSKNILLAFVAFLLFWFLTTIGYQVGGKFGFEQMLYNFGEPRDLYPLLFAYASVFTGYLFSFFGVIIGFIAMHQLGRRFNLSVLKPSLFGLLAYLIFSFFTS